MPTYLQAERVRGGASDIVSARMVINRRRRVGDEADKNGVREGMVRRKKKKFIHGGMHVGCRADLDDDSPILPGDHDVSLLIEDHYHGNHGCRPL